MLLTTEPSLPSLRKAITKTYSLFNIQPFIIMTGKMVHAFNHSTQKTEITVNPVPGLPELHRPFLRKKKKIIVRTTCNNVKILTKICNCTIHHIVHTSDKPCKGFFLSFPSFLSFSFSLPSFLFFPSLLLSACSLSLNIDTDFSKLICWFSFPQQYLTTCFMPTGIIISSPDDGWPL